MDTQPRRHDRPHAGRIGQFRDGDPSLAGIPCGIGEDTDDEETLGLVRIAKYEADELRSLSDKARRFHKLLELDPVRSTVEDLPGTVESVVDDGPGIPPEERSAIVEGNERPLYHASGLGIRFVKWCLHLSGGTLTIESNDPRGTVVVSLPRADAYGTR